MDARLTFLTYLPLAVEGFALTTASSKALGVVVNLVGLKGNLADSNVNYACLIDAIFDFSGLCFFDCRC